MFSYLFFCLFLAFLLLSTSFLVPGTGLSSELLSSYECGFEPIGTSHVPFCMKFFLLALIFLVFDVEVALLVPSLFASLLSFSFLLVLLLGLLFEYAFGGLD